MGLGGAGAPIVHISAPALALTARGDDERHRMPRSSLTLHPAGARARLLATVVLAMVALVFALVVSQQASAQAHKAACAPTSPHATHLSHTCSTSKIGKGHGKGKPKGHHAKHATGEHHTATGTGQTSNAAGDEAVSAASCSDGTNATANEEGGFTCANGSEPGCAEGLDPALSNDGSTLLCEPEANGGEDAEATPTGAEEAS
jgi:hypothetical protein